LVGWFLALKGQFVARRCVMRGIVKTFVLGLFTFLLANSYAYAYGYFKKVWVDYDVIDLSIKPDSTITVPVKAYGYAYSLRWGKDWYSISLSFKLYYNPKVIHRPHNISVTSQPRAYRISFKKSGPYVVSDTQAYIQLWIYAIYEAEYYEYYRALPVKLTILIDFQVKSYGISDLVLRNVYRVYGTIGHGYFNNVIKADFTTEQHGRATLFDGSASKSNVGPIISYTWDFGDGTLRVAKKPRIAHGYKEPGTYYVSLTVTDGIWRSRPMIKKVIVE
jgi:hypothetical protein